MKKLVKKAVSFVMIVLITLIGIALFILLPSVQLWLTRQASQYLYSQYGISTSIEGIKIGFPKNILMDGLLVNDQFLTEDRSLGQAGLLVGGHIDGSLCGNLVLTPDDLTLDIAPLGVLTNGRRGEKGHVPGEYWQTTQNELVATRLISSASQAA